MSGLVAVFNRTGAPVDPAVIQAMLAASPHRAIDGQDCWISGPVALAHQHFWVTPEEVGEKQPLVADHGAGGTLAVTFDGRLDNRQELLRALKLVAPEQQWSDVALVLQSYQRWGEGCAERLLGDFAFALWDGFANSLLLARDSLGARELHFYLSEDWLVAASEIGQVLAHPIVSRRLNEAKVAEYLAGVWLSPGETFYSNVRSCPPGHVMKLTANLVQHRQYWSLNPEMRLRYRDDLDYAAHFRALFTDAVGCRLRTTARVGISLSGGMDSTSVAAVASPLLAGTPAGQTRLKSFSYVFDELSSCDEREYIQPVVKRCGLDPTWLVADHLWTLQDVSSWPSSPAAPTGDAYARLPLAVMQAARDSGCRLLLNGQFGDALFSSGRYWAINMLRDMRLRPMFAVMTQSNGSFNWRRDLVAGGLAPLASEGMATVYRRRRRGNRIPQSIDACLAARTNLEDRLQPNTGTPSGVSRDRRSRYRGLTGEGWSQGIALAREFGHRHQVEFAMPWWDRRLVEFIMAVPADQLGRPGRTRWVQRNAMTGLLPEIVRQRSAKTSFRALLQRGLLDREHTTVTQLLSDPQIVQRGFVEQLWLNAELAAGDGWTSEGYLLWQALSLELWLQRFWM